MRLRPSAYSANRPNPAMPMAKKTRSDTETLLWIEVRA